MGLTYFGHVMASEMPTHGPSTNIILDLSLNVVYSVAGEYYIAVILMVFAGIVVSIVNINIVHLTCAMPTVMEKVSTSSG